MGICQNLSTYQGVYFKDVLFPHIYLSYVAIETLAVAIRDNDIKGILKIGEIEKKVSLFADDTICFLNGDTESFVNLFEILHYFASFSGCRLNVSKSEAIYIGSSKDTPNHPYQEEGLTWRTKSFKALGINFSLQTNLLYEMNFPPRLKKVEQTVNCWRQRNLSLIVKISVIKSLLLPQLLYIYFQYCVSISPGYFLRS